MKEIRCCFAVFLLLLPEAPGVLGQSGVTFDFNDGMVPGGTTIPNTPDGANLPNAGVGVAGSGGFANSACLRLTVPFTGHTYAGTYGQWCITNDLAGAAAISSFTASFLLLMGDGSGGNAGVPNAGGNGFVFHLGPTPPTQLTGSDSTWGNGLDVNFRTYNSGGNETTGINIAYNTVGKFHPGGGTIIAKNSFPGFFQTNGAADSFSEAVTVSVTLTNGALSVVCSNGLLGKVTVFNNLVIPGFVPISPAQMAFTATDGKSAHEDCCLDNVDLTVNGLHLAPVHGTGPPQIVQQTGNVTMSAGYATFSVAASGPSPYTYQWLCNGVPIEGATAASWSTPQMMNFDYMNLGATSATLTIPVTSAMNGAVYSAAVSNAYGKVISSGATLTVLGPSFNPPVLSNGYNGKWLSLALNNWADGTLYWATSPVGPWAALSSGTNSQFSIPVSLSTPQCFYRARGTNPLIVTNYTRFYSATSFWNTPIGANPPIDSNSTAIVQASLVNCQSQAAFLNASYGVAVAFARSTDKVYTVPCTLYPSPSCAPGGPGVQFPIPAGTTTVAGTDGQMAVVYQALDGTPYAGKELDIWQAVYDPTNDTWSGSSVTVNDLFGWGATCPPGGRCNGSDAGGVALLGGIIRPEEIAQGHIDHALSLATPVSLSNYIACPGTHTDGTAAAPSLPEGARIQLDPNYNVDAQNWPQWLKLMAHALQTYGAYNRGTGGVLSIWGVSDQNPGVPSWTSVGVPVEQHSTLSNLNVLPWASMRVIQITSCN
jgi:hypothetical protein